MAPAKALAGVLLLLVLLLLGGAVVWTLTMLVGELVLLMFVMSGMGDMVRSGGFVAFLKKIK